MSGCDGTSCASASGTTRRYGPHLPSGYKKIPGLEMIVFDLDYTLWNGRMGQSFIPPFSQSDYGQIIDKLELPVESYPDSEAILQKLKSCGYMLGIASRTGAVAGAKELIELLGWNEYFNQKDLIQIYPGKKTRHLKKLKKSSGLSFSQMIFLDDDMRNIQDVSKIGVMSIFVENGLNHDLMLNSLKAFADNPKSL